MAAAVSSKGGVPQALIERWPEARLQTPRQPQNDKIRGIITKNPLSNLGNPPLLVKSGALNHGEWSIDGFAGFDHRKRIYFSRLDAEHYIQKMGGKPPVKITAKMIKDGQEVGVQYAVKLATLQLTRSWLTVAGRVTLVVIAILPTAPILALLCAIPCYNVFFSHLVARHIRMDVLCYDDDATDHCYQKDLGKKFVVGDQVSMQRYWDEHKVKHKKSHGEMEYMTPFSWLDFSYLLLKYPDGTFELTIQADKRGRPLKGDKAIEARAKEVCEKAMEIYKQENSAIK